MRSLGIPIAVISCAPLVLYVVAMVVQDWHSFDRSDGVTVDFGLDQICFNGACHDCLHAKRRGGV